MDLRLNDELTLTEARRLISRCVDKAEALGQRGTFIVVDASGAPVTASRMEGSGGGALPIVRAKAFVSAVNGEPSARFAARMAQFHAGIFDSYQRVLRDQPFPGAGGVLIERAGCVAGAIATGVGIGPFVKLPNVTPTQLLVKGQPTNLEDLIISYALGGSYNPQHGDDGKRWREAYGTAPPTDDAGNGLDEVPTATGQRSLTYAIALSDHAIGIARDQHMTIAVAVVDHRGDTIRLDRMDGTAPMAVDVAEAVAVAAINFRLRTSDISTAFPDSRVLTQIIETVPYRMVTVGGGALIGRDDKPEGAIGIAGANPEISQRIADVVGERTRIQ